MTEIQTLTCNWGYVRCVDGTVVDIDDANQMVEEPDWDSLKALLVQAERWMLFDDDATH
jgi:hypothetical protein